MKQQIDIFIFANPKSGSKKGQRFIDMEFKNVSMEIDQSTDVVMHIVNLTIPEKKFKAIKEMKELQRKYNSKQKITHSSSNTHSNHRRIILTIAGGDGTMMYIA